MTKRYIFAAALATASLVGIATYHPTADPGFEHPRPTTTIPDSPCWEDQPCWDCETMGNRICGPLPR